MLIEAIKVSKRYFARGPMIVEDISFTVDRGETLAVFGDSGSGKSTIGQILAGLFPVTTGEVRLDGEKLTYPYRGKPRKRIQILFQHPEVAFDPKMKLADSMKEPYLFLKMPYSRKTLCGYLERYGIYDEHLERRPAELSGGELQRLALARAMLLEPSFPCWTSRPLCLMSSHRPRSSIYCRKSSGKRDLGTCLYPMTWLSASIFVQRSFTCQEGSCGRQKREQMCRNSAGSKRRK